MIHTCLTTETKHPIFLKSVLEAWKLVIEIRHLEEIGFKIEHPSQIGDKMGTNSNIFFEILE